MCWANLHTGSVLFLYLNVELFLSSYPQKLEPISVAQNKELQKKLKKKKKL